MHAHDVIAQTFRTVPTDLGFETVRLWDGTTWTLGDDRIVGGFRVSTVFSPVRFAPAYGLDGTPRHFRSAVTGTAEPWPFEEVTYRTEPEAKAGHAALVAKYRQMTGRQGAA